VNEERRMEPKWAVAISPDGFVIESTDGTSFDMSEEDGLEGVTAKLNALEDERDELRAALERIANGYYPGKAEARAIAGHALSRLQPETTEASSWEHIEEVLAERLTESRKAAEARIAELEAELRDVNYWQCGCLGGPVEV